MKIRKHQRPIAVFFLLNFLNLIFAPGLYAGNVIADEYESFLPAGSTDMVNNLTGDFHYDVPLFEVPGPEGGYPIHLFYQAGIQNNKDASWTGLGWNLNVGAITRQVKDIPDDFSNAPYLLDDTLFDGSGSYAMINDWWNARALGNQLAMEDAGTPYHIPFAPDGTAMQYGVLHADSASFYNIHNFTGAHLTFDCHSLYGDNLPDTLEASVPEYSWGGSMPSCDRYTVSGEGLSGEIEPVILENGSLFRSDIQTTGYFYSIPSPSSYYSAWRQYGNFSEGFKQPKQFFRFKNEFSNSFVDSTISSFYYVNPITSPVYLAYPVFNAYSPYYVDPGYTTCTPQDPNGFDPLSFRLAGGKHVDYFLNTEITSGTAKAAGFMDYPFFINENGGYSSSSSERKQLTYFSKNYNVKQRVGGFSITNEEGVTYHYALPVYTYKNISTKTLKSQNITASRIATNNNPYAYSWLLTTITGPDFVDKNGNGYADEADLGKWTNFSYGKATSSYLFKTPYSGYQASISSSQLSSSGYMELYYLDAAYTRSHTALFSKASRSDVHDGTGDSTLALKLNSAILFHNDGIKKISDGMSWTYSDIYSALKNIKAANSSYNTSIITTNDISTISSTSGSLYVNQILKESKLYYDYSLANGAPNNTTGKLTLDSLRTFGKSNSALEPSTIFSYELSSPASTSITFTSIVTPSSGTAGGSTGSISITSNVFSEGDILKVAGSSTTYIVLTKATSSSTYNVSFLSSVGVVTSTGYTATQTKNPPYCRFMPGTGQSFYADLTDEWGYFKSDMGWDDSLIFNRETSRISGLSTDCWSLRKITTPLGGTIEVAYESDSYYDHQLTSGEIFNVNQPFKYTDATTLSLSSTATPQCDFRNIKADTAGVFEFTIKENTAGKVSVGQTIKFVTLGTFTYNSSPRQWVSKSGEDSFYITYLDTASNVIRGKFRLPASGSKTNPFWISNPYSSSHANIFYHNCSFIIQEAPTISYGGGIRVKSITTKEGNGEIYTTSYGYHDRFTNANSGTCAFEPMLERSIVIPQASGSTLYSFGSYSYYNSDLLNINIYTSEYYSALDYYQKKARQPIAKALSAVDFVSPEVLYEFVTVSSSSSNNQNIRTAEYQYQPYTWDMLKRTVSSGLSSGTGSVDFVGKITIQDYTSSVGQLLNSSEYDIAGNLLSRTSYTYTSSPPSKQGRLDQVFHEYLIHSYLSPSGNDLSYAEITVLSKYPSVISRITTTDYLKNITSFKDYHKFDFYSGNPTETVSKTSEGDYFKQRQVPAYSKSGYSGMGLKFSSATNRNMISPLTASYTYKVSSSNYDSHIDTLSCSVNTWNNIWNKRVFNTSGMFYADSAISTDVSGTIQDDRIWRPQSTYAWKSPLLNSDGSYKNFVDFTWSGTPNSNWQKVSSITRYDQFSNVQEKQDINGNYTSVKYGYDLNYPLTGSDNANYTELSYSGAEDLNSSAIYGNTGCLGGEVQLFQGTQDTTFAHSGKNSLKLSPGNFGFIYKVKINSTNGIVINKPYRVTAWIYDNGNTSAEIYCDIQDSTGTSTVVNNSSISLGTMTSSPVTSGNWKQLTLDFTLTGSYNNYLLTIGFSNPSSIPAYFDDFRFHPLSETISSNVYDKTTGLVTYSLDKNNFYSKRVYDNIFRPLGDYKETINGEIKKKEYGYNYGRGN